MQKEYEKMAEQFVSLWQEQVSQYLKDPAVMKATMDAWQNFSKMHEFKGGEDVSQSTVSIDVDTFNHILARLARCEQRITELESALDASVGQEASARSQEAV